MDGGGNHFQIYTKDLHTYLCDDSSALLEYSGSSAPDNVPNEVTPDSGPGETDNSYFMDEMMSITELPVKNISCVGINVDK